jgi:co-chaperonin GroES (HSP10)
MAIKGKSNMTPKPLRGRVVIRVEQPKKIGSIHLVDQFWENQNLREHNEGKRSKASAVGTVLAMGPPALCKNQTLEVPPGFQVGDKVSFQYWHNEKAFTHAWVDGLPCFWAAQEEILAVIEES